MSKLLRFVLLALLISVSLAVAPFQARTSIPQTSGQAYGPFVETSLPGLETFIGQVKTGAASQVTGLYVADVFAFPVVQQPADKPAPAGRTFAFRISPSASISFCYALQADGRERVRGSPGAAVSIALTYLTDKSNTPILTPIRAPSSRPVPSPRANAQRSA